MDRQRGFRFFYRIREGLATQHIPVILLTVLPKSTVRNLLEMEGGLTVYRSKSSDLNELIAIVKGCINLFNA
ncbi:MAG: hypothetical protein AAF921_03690 [Cyanobacteria bacterium P01_D01_bin.44]